MHFFKISKKYKSVLIKYCAKKLLVQMWSRFAIHCVADGCGGGVIGATAAVTETRHDASVDAKDHPRDQFTVGLHPVTGTIEWPKSSRTKISCENIMVTK